MIRAGQVVHTAWFYSQKLRKAHLLPACADMCRHMRVQSQLLSLLWACQSVRAHVSGCLFLVTE